MRTFIATWTFEHAARELLELKLKRKQRAQIEALPEVEEFLFMKESQP